MINLLPHQEETVVLAHEWDTVLARLSGEIGKPMKAGIPTTLSGWIKDDEFELTLKTRRFNAFMPLVKGRIEPTTKGCILFLNYSLLRANKLFLHFWTFFLIVSGILLIVFEDELLGNACILLVIFIYGVAWANFKMHLKATRAILMGALN